ncbi:MAG: hypothetical protein M1282_01875 [Chloroflexi bacterium]|nr:hypothetical protein [Chloroflexota bacterium]
MPFSDYLNSLLGIKPQQPGHPVIGGAVGHASLTVSDPDVPTQVMNARVFLIIYNPTMDPNAGTKLSVYKNWSDPDELINGFVSDLTQVSGGLANYQITQRVELDEFPALADGFVYNPQTFLDVINGTTPPHTPMGIDYNAILTRFDILQNIADDVYDEVWVVAFPYAGLYESTMGGAGAFWCNGPALQNTSSCSRRFVVMGLSYERTVGEMLHSYAHRCESIMAQVYHCQDFLTWAYQPNRSPATISPTQTLNLFQRFILFDKIAPGRAALGTVHYAPNSVQDYDYGNQTLVRSECYDWENFPDFKGDVRSVATSEWGGGDDGAFQRWWLSHMPKVKGIQNGIANNWWQYVANPNNVRV